MYQIAVGLLLGQVIILLGAVVLAILLCLGAACIWEWDYVFRPSTLCPQDPSLWYGTGIGVREPLLSVQPTGFRRLM